MNSAPPIGSKKAPVFGLNSASSSTSGPVGADSGEALYREVFQLLPDGLFWLDGMIESPSEEVNFVIRDVNAVGAAILGQVRENIVGQRITELLDFDSHPNWLEKYSKAWTTQQSLEEVLLFKSSCSMLPNRWMIQKITPLDKGLLVSIKEDTARLEIEKYMVQTESRLVVSQAIAKLGSWEYDTHGKLWWSDEIYRILGIEPNSIQPDKEAFLSLVHSDDLDSLKTLLQSTLCSELSLHSEFRLTSFDGKNKFLRLCGQGAEDGEKNLRFAGTLQDLTESKENKAKQIQEKQLLQQVVNHAPLVLYALDTEGTITLSQGKGLAAQGFSPGELEGTNIFNVYRDHPHLLDKVRTAMAGEAMFSVMETNGVFYERWMEPVRDEEGRQAGMIGMSLDVTAWKQAEEQQNRSLVLLKKSEDQFRNLIEGSIQGILIIGANQRVLFANQAIEDMGWPLPASLIGRNAEEIVLAGFLDDLREDFRDLLAGTVASAKGVANLTRDTGDNIVFEYLARAIEWEGQPAVQYTLVDVTEREIATSELQASQALLRTVIDSVPQAIMVKDLEGRYVMANKSFADFHGWDSEQIIGRTAFELPGLSANVAKRQEELDARVLETRQPIELPNLSFIRPDGELTWHTVLKIPLLDSQDRLQGIVTVGENITDQKRIEEELTHSQNLLKGIFDTMPARIAVSDQQGQPILINKKQAEAIGLPAEIAIQRGISCPQVDGIDHQQIKTEIQAVINQGRSFDYERSMKDPDGRDVYERVQRVPLRGPENSITGTLSTVIDISEQKRMESELRQAQKMEAIGLLAGGVAHDFNNLLQIMSGCAEIAMAEGGKNPRFLRAAGQIVSTIDRAGNLTRQLLMFSRRKALQPKTVNLNELVTNLVTMLERLIGEQISVNLTPAAVPVIGMVDQGMIEQVVMNLCVNARDAMREGGTLKLGLDLVRVDRSACRNLELDKPGEYICITIADNGTGMDEGNLERIFEPFFTTKEEGAGSGLGLSIVYGIVKQHGGSIQVESKLGKGTNFRVFLPRAKKDQKPTKKSLSKNILGGSERILLVEDEIEVLKTLADLLESQGYQVVCARDGEEAMHIFQSLHDEINLVITDMVMPKVSGRELVIQIRNLAPDMRIIISTGYTSDGLDLTFLQENNLPVIEKPYSPREFFKIVRDCLDATSE